MFQRFAEWFVYLVCFVVCNEISGLKSPAFAPSAVRLAISAFQVSAYQRLVSSFSFQHVSF
jgi:hypothetical protein